MRNAKQKKTVPAKNSEAIFWRPPVHKAPPGRRKERTRILPVRRGFSAPGVPRRLPGWSFLRGLPFLRRLLCPVFRHFSAGVPLSCPRLAGSLLLLRLVWPVLPGACLPLAAVRLCVRGFCCRFCGLFGSPPGVQGGAAARAAVREACLRWARVLRPLLFDLSLRPRRLAASTFFRKDLDKAAVCLPSVRLCLRVFRLSFVCSCLTFASQNSFHLSLMPRRAPHFLFGKKMGEKNREGLRPFEPHSCALRPIFSFSALLAGLTALRAANRRLTGKRLKSQGAKLSFSSVSVRRGDACSLWPISPFLSLLAGLTALRAAIRRLARETPEKPKEQSSAFRAFLCVGDAPGPFAWLGFLPATGNRGQDFWLARETPEKPKGNQPRACETRGRKRQGRELPTAGCARIAQRSRGLSPCPGKQKPCAGAHPEPAACVRDVGKKKTGSANCPPQVCANCSAQPRRRKSSAKLCGKRLDNSDKLYYNK